MSNDLLISSRCLMILFLCGLYEQLKSHFLLCRLISKKKTLCKREIKTECFSRYVLPDVQYYPPSFNKKLTVWKAMVEFYMVEFWNDKLITTHSVGEGYIIHLQFTIVLSLSANSTWPSFGYIFRSFLLTLNTRCRFAL